MQAVGRTTPRSTRGIIRESNIRANFAQNRSTGASPVAATCRIASVSRSVGSSIWPFVATTRFTKATARAGCAPAASNSLVRPSSRARSATSACFSVARAAGVSRRQIYAPCRKTSDGEASARPSAAACCGAGSVLSACSPPVVNANRAPAAPRTPSAFRRSATTGRGGFVRADMGVSMRIAEKEHFV